MSKTYQLFGFTIIVSKQEKFQTNIDKKQAKEQAREMTGTAEFSELKAKALAARAARNTTVTA